MPSTQSNITSVYRFGDLIEGGTRNGVYKQKQFHGSGVKVVNMGELFANPRLRGVPMKRIQLTEAEINKSDIRPGDLLFARRSLVAEGAGKCIVVMEVNEPTTFESSIIRARPKQEIVDSLYLYYFFNSPPGLHSLGTIRRQVAVSGITGTDLVELPIQIPPLAEQKRIAGILGALDDKIELNRKMNETLEQMAKALFKSWFVDFEPVHAKAAGRQPSGMDKATADLFPSSFVDSELGKIPFDWSIKTLEQLANQIAMGPFGSDIKVSSFVDKGVPVISGQHLRGSLLEDSDFNFVSIEHADRLKRSNVQRGDVVFTHAGSIGQVAYIPESSKYQRYIISQRQFYLRCNRSLISPFYILLYFKTPEGQHRLLANTSSTGVPSISQPVTYLRQLKILVPPLDVLEKFDDNVSMIFQKKADNELQSKTLLSLRDSLLKKLLS